MRILPPEQGSTESRPGLRGELNQPCAGKSPMPIDNATQCKNSVITLQHVKNNVKTLGNSAGNSTAYSAKQKGGGQGRGGSGYGAMQQIGGNALLAQKAVRVADAEGALAVMNAFRMRMGPMLGML